MTKAAVLHKPGPPENFSWEDLEVGDPGPGEARVRHGAVGLNFVDTHFRSGDYPPGPLPAILGREAAGVVEAVGDGVTEVAVGQRVGYAPEMGAYAEARVMPVARLVPLESDAETERRILEQLRAGDGAVLVDEATFLQPTASLAGWKAD